MLSVVDVSSSPSHGGGCRVSSTVHYYSLASSGSSGFAHLGGAHSGCGRHHALAALGRSWTRPISLLKLVTLQSLLVLNALLRVLIRLQNLVVLYLTQLESLIHTPLQLLPQCVHLILLFLHEFGFGSQDLFMAIFKIPLALTLFHFIGALLHLVSLLIILLLGQIGLDLAQVEKLRGELECDGQLLLQRETVLFKGFGVCLLEAFNLALILLLGLLQFKIPMGIKVLILLKMGILDFLLSLLVGEHQGLHLNVELLLFQLGHSILGHLSLNIFTVVLALESMLLHSHNEVLDVLLVDLGIGTAILVWTILHSLARILKLLLRH